VNPAGLQLYSVREQLAVDRKGVLAQVAGFGYRVVETFNVLNDPEGLHEDLTAVGLSVGSAHAHPGAEPDATAAALRTLGTDVIIVPYLPPDRYSSAETVAEVAAELNTLAAWAAGEGLSLGYHNHDFELSSLIGGRTALEVLTDQLDASVFLEVDTYWAAVGGQDVPELLGRLGDRVKYLHVKDGPITKDDPMTAVGSGRMPVAEILAASPSTGHIVELDRCATDMLTAVGDSLNWLVAQGLA
jgi:sugar phosphate isomerase/epimerase